MTNGRNEAQTRREIIDHCLRLAGWNVDDPSQVIQELDIDLAERRTGQVREPIVEYSAHRFADYALLLRGRRAAVVEAKKTSIDARRRNPMP